MPPESASTGLWLILVCSIKVAIIWPTTCLSLHSFPSLPRIPIPQIDEKFSNDMCEPLRGQFIYWTQLPFEAENGHIYYGLLCDRIRRLCIAKYREFKNLFILSKYRQLIKYWFCLTNKYDSFLMMMNNIKLFKYFLENSDFRKIKRYFKNKPIFL